VMAYLQPGGQSGSVWPRRAIPFFKPVVVFSKRTHGRKWFGDVVKSERNDKRFHKWGQSESGMVDLVNRLADPGATILDPFCGSGTTGVACVKTGRNFVGIEINEEYCEIARKRIARAAEEPSLFADKSLAELASQQGVSPVQNIDSLKADGLWDSDEDFNAFVGKGGAAAPAAREAGEEDSTPF